MTSLSHDAFGQPSYSQTSDPTQSLSWPHARRTSAVKDYRTLKASIFELHFSVIRATMEICETDPTSSVEAGGLFSNIADFHRRRHLEFLIRLLIGPIFQDAILDLENNRVYCSRNNSLLSFSAPDWLPLI